MRDVTETKPVETQHARLVRLVGNPKTIDNVCMHIAGGGTLKALSDLWDVHYGELHNWLNKDQEIVTRIRLALVAREEYIKDGLLQQLTAMVDFDIRDMYLPNGQLKNVHDLPDKVALAIHSIKSTELLDDDGALRGHTKEIKPEPKQKAIELLAKLNSLLTDRVEHQHTIMTMEELVLGSMIEEEVEVTEEEGGTGISSPGVVSK